MVCSAQSSFPAGSRDPKALLLREPPAEVGADTFFQSLGSAELSTCRLLPREPGAGASRDGKVGMPHELGLVFCLCLAFGSSSLQT